jgi:hypothetical protein
VTKALRLIVIFTAAAPGMASAQTGGASWVVVGASDGATAERVATFRARSERQLQASGQRVVRAVLVVAVLRGAEGELQRCSPWRAVC